MRTEGAKIVLRPGCSAVDVIKMLGNGRYLFESNRFGGSHQWLNLFEITGDHITITDDEVQHGGIARHILMEVHGDGR